MCGGGCPALEDGDTFICRRVEGATVSWIELESNPFIDVRPTKLGNVVMAGMIRLIPNQRSSWIGIPPKPRDSLKPLSHREY